MAAFNRIRVVRGGWLGQVGGAVGFGRASIIYVKSFSHWLAMTLTQSISIFLGSDGPAARGGIKKAIDDRLRIAFL